MTTRTLNGGLLAAAALTALTVAPAAFAQDVAACLITKTDTNPFFVKMREGAEAKAKELGVSLSSYAGKVDGDNESQVAAVETCVANGAKGILITASDTAAITPVLKTARDAGVLVIALDTPLDPADAADATFATDNFQAGLLIGEWAKATLGDKAADAKIALLDLAISQPSVDVLRDQGFLQGFGIDLGDPKKWGDESDPRIVGHDVTAGNEQGGQQAMENLLVKDPDINLVYTINEPAAAGAFQALKAVGREKDVMIVSVDGGCPGVQYVKEGVIGATSQQYPLQMAALGIEAIKNFADTGEKPAPTEGKDFFDTGVTLITETEGKDFFDTGVTLITDKPVDGVESIDSAKGLDLCWG